MRGVRSLGEQVADGCDSLAAVTDLGRWAVGLRGLADWLAQGRPGD